MKGQFDSSNTMMINERNRLATSSVYGDHILLVNGCIQLSVMSTTISDSDLSAEHLFGHD